jgi:hypothetical protein
MSDSGVAATKNADPGETARVAPSTGDVVIAGEMWEPIPHVCATCFGRVLRRHGADGVVYRCADCDREGAGTERAICACGAARRIQIRCQPNENRSAEVPSAIVAAEVPS